MKYKLTDEQLAIVDVCKSGKHPFVQVNAVAGSSKSTTGVEVARALKTKGRYLSFNKEIANEAVGLFKGTDTDVVTTNALAYRYVITKGLVDHSTARSKFIKIVSRYVSNFSLDKKYTQKHLSFNIKKLTKLPIKTVKIIEKEYDTFLKSKRELDIAFGFSSITEQLSGEDKRLFISLLEEFCNSKHLSVTDFLVKKGQTYFTDLMGKYLTKMVNKEIGVPFVFNLKYYHILLSRGLIKEKELGLLILDEASDSSEVVLEIFNLIPAKQKLMVGDTAQKINSFAYCVDGFEYFKDKGVSLSLTTSFRLPVGIARQIEIFGKKHLSKDFIFKGFDKPYPENPTIAYLSRTNAGLIKQMDVLQQKGIDYKLTRSVKLIFGLIKVLIYISPRNKIFNTKYKYLEHDIAEWNKSSATRTQYKTLLNYIKFHHTENVEVQSAISILYAQGRKEILATMDRALAVEKKKAKKAQVTIATTHSIKGKSFTEVYLNDDLDITKILEIPLNERTLEEQEAVYLFYVCTTRATHKLYNAKHLE